MVFEGLSLSEKIKNSRHKLVKDYNILKEPDRVSIPGTFKLHLYVSC